jgi:hypothetical protein
LGLNVADPMDGSVRQADSSVCRQEWRSVRCLSPHVHDERDVNFFVVSINHKAPLHLLQTVGFSNSFPCILFLTSLIMVISTSAVAGIATGVAVVAIIIIAVVVVINATLHFGGGARLYLQLGDGTRGYLTTAGGGMSIDMSGKGTAFTFISGNKAKTGQAISESDSSEFFMFDGANYVSLAQTSGVCSFVMTPDASAASTMYFQDSGFTSDPKKTIQFNDGYMLSPNGTPCAGGDAVAMDPTSQKLTLSNQKDMSKGNFIWYVEHA